MADATDDAAPWAHDGDDADPKTNATTPRAPRIEGGYDAIIVGATIDGLIASVYLSKAGLKTVVLECGSFLVDQERAQIAPDYYYDEHEQ